MLACCQYYHAHPCELCAAYMCSQMVIDCYQINCAVHCHDRNHRIAQIITSQCFNVPVGDYLREQQLLYYRSMVGIANPLFRHQCRVTVHSVSRAMSTHHLTTAVVMQM